MFDCIKEISETFDDIDMRITGTKASAFLTNLLVMRYECTKLETKNSKQFHKVVAKILFATNKDRLGTGTVISYLKMHVIGPD